MFRRNKFRVPHEDERSETVVSQPMSSPRETPAPALRPVASPEDSDILSDLSNWEMKDDADTRSLIIRKPDDFGLIRFPNPSTAVLSRFKRSKRARHRWQLRGDADVC